MGEQSRNVIVSGAARGIGRSLSRHFLDKGDRVFLLDIQEDELKYCVDVHLKQHADRAAYGVCDLRDPESIRQAIKKAALFFGGRIDVLVNNGGIAAPQWRDGKTMEDPDTLAEWQAYMETNLTAPFVTSQACLPFMKRDEIVATDAGAEALASNIESTPGPCIVHIGSFRAHQSDPNQEGYAASKAGQLGLMHSMAISLARWGIRVNLVAPGRIKAAHECREGDEAGDGAGWANQVAGKDVADHPTNRAGRPRDVAQAVEYLVGAGFVTGEELTVDGGALKKKN
ncbi:short chain alcohol dehydrogenase [Apiospora marii]|uniref:Short chain alcohol dehydrogenase n=1 Tax=Apiospora marii TaxID=335849 RepID=A0ABR1RCQ6_9PEZI